MNTLYDITGRVSGVPDFDRNKTFLPAKGGKGKFTAEFVLYPV